MNSTTDSLSVDMSMKLDAKIVTLLATQDAHAPKKDLGHESRAGSEN